MACFYSTFASLPRLCPGIPFSNITLTHPLFPCVADILPVMVFLSLLGVVQVTFLPIIALASSLFLMFGRLSIIWLPVRLLRLPLNALIVAIWFVKLGSI